MRKAFPYIGAFGFLADRVKTAFLNHVIDFFKVGA
jgi:hypothetical protein